MFIISCASIGIFLFLGSSGNALCILVFLRKKFRNRMVTPYFIVLLFADSIYLLFRLIKLFYYSRTLLNQNANSEESCSNTLFARAYHHATQTWPQTLVPLVHFETYMRFSLILMSIISVQRTTIITRSLKRLVLPETYNHRHKYKWIFLFIILAFVFAYAFEFARLTLFCSKSNNRDISYEWFMYTNTNMTNSTYLLTNTMIDQPDSLKCVNYVLKSLQEQQNQSSIIYNNSICTKEQFMNILSHYFDQHQKSIVYLIQKILYHQTGERITRNEIRRKFHFHECLFPQEPNFFHSHYNFMYNRMFGFNRYTLILVLGSVLPSLITIISSMLSVYRIRHLYSATSNYILPCRRRIDDTRRVLIVITIECLFAIMNSWLSDILLALVYCEGKLLPDDDCPMFLKKSSDLLIMSDVFNSISNIILHCLCGKHFRNELYRMLQSFCQIIQRLLKNICCCYLQIHFQQYNQDQYACYNASITRTDSSNNGNPEHIYLEIDSSPRLLQHYCCDCRWYFNRKPLVSSGPCLSRISKEYLRKNRISFTAHYHSLPQSTHITSNTMRLYFPQQQTTTTTTSSSSSSERKKWFSCFR